MSKLSKFKYNITISEAAKLLSRLINEEVADEDIESLLSAHWIDGYYMCDCTIVKVDFFCGAEQHKKYTDLGIYAVKTSKEVGKCFGLPYPCGHVFLDGITSTFALTDKDGALYVLRDTETGQYLRQDADPVFFTDLVIEADSIYKLAKLANIDEPAPVSEIELIENKWCEGEVKYYPFFPDGWQSKSKPEQKMRSTQINFEAPPSALAIASLLEIVLDKNRKNLNQTSIKLEIAERNRGIKGLSDSNLNIIFSNANALLKAARNAIKVG